MNADKHALQVLRHSTAHLLAHAVQELYPTTLLTIGPATETGFFYDMLPKVSFKEEDLPAIEERMREIAKRNIPLEHFQMAKDQARELYRNNPFKLELIDGIEGDTVGIAKQGDFYDLCRGGHVAKTGDIKHFMLLHTSGSYWRADRNGQPLQRITGTAFLTKEDLKEFKQRREDAIKYDHRRLGKELDLFSFHEEGVGFPFFHPRGKIILNLITNYMRDLIAKAGYQEISTPLMLADDLWKQSGHYAHYKDNMYFCDIEEKSYAIKPMNCPGAILLYQERPRSYRDLPLRFAEFGLVHRYELSGVLNGLFRVRAFTQDDAHVFCTADQVTHETLAMVEMTKHVMNRFGFNTLHVGVSTRPEKSMGSDELWDIGTQALKDALTQAHLPFEIYEGEGAFYGPKIEFGIEDSLGRKWQCGTIQVDFFQPQNFNLSYVNSEGTKSQPVMIHRVIYGSLERFFGIMLEHYKGKLPFWISPLQIAILTITDEQKQYASRIATLLKAAGYRVSVDESSDPISGKIKRAQTQQVPCMLVIGNKESEQETVTIRHRDGKQEFGVSLEQLAQRLEELNQN